MSGTRGSRERTRVKLASHCGHKLGAETCAISIASSAQVQRERHTTTGQNGTSSSAGASSGPPRAQRPCCTRSSYTASSSHRPRGVRGPRRAPAAAHRTRQSSVGGGGDQPPGWRRGRKSASPSVPRWRAPCSLVGSQLTASHACIHAGIVSNIVQNFCAMRRAGRWLAVAKLVGGESSWPRVGHARLHCVDAGLNSTPEKTCASCLRPPCPQIQSKFSFIRPRSLCSKDFCLDRSLSPCVYVTRHGACFCRSHRLTTPCTKSRRDALSYASHLLRSWKINATCCSTVGHRYGDPVDHGAAGSYRPCRVECSSCLLTFFSATLVVLGHTSYVVYYTVQ